MSSADVCVYCEFFLWVCECVCTYTYRRKTRHKLLAYTCMCVCIHTNVFMCIHTYTLIKSLELTFIRFSIVVEGAGGEDKLAKFFAGMLTVNPFVFPIIYNIYKYLSEKNVENHKMNKRVPFEKSSFRKTSAFIKPIVNNAVIAWRYIMLHVVFHQPQSMNLLYGLNKFYINMT